MSEPMTERDQAPVVSSEGDDGLTPAVRAEHICAIKLAKAEAERDAAIRERDEAEARGFCCPECGQKERAEKAEAEVQALREQLADLEKMRCPECSAIAPENEKDWPKTECVVCVTLVQVEALRARIEKLEQLIRETLSRRSKSREHKFAMPTECGTWDRMEALLSESENEG